MVWYAWLILGWNALAAVINILTIGEPRKPRTLKHDRIIVLVVVLMLCLQSWAIVELAT